MNDLNTNEYIIFYPLRVWGAYDWLTFKIQATALITRTEPLPQKAGGGARAQVRVCVQ